MYLRFGWSKSLARLICGWVKPKFCNPQPKISWQTLFNC